MGQDECVNLRGVLVIRPTSIEDCYFTIVHYENTSPLNLEIPGQVFESSNYVTSQIS